LVLLVLDIQVQQAQQEEGLEVLDIQVQQVQQVYKELLELQDHLEDHKEIQDQQVYKELDLQAH
jgi:hypothetical protein